MTTAISYRGDNVDPATDVNLWNLGLVGMEQCIAAVLQIPHDTTSTDYPFRIGNLTTYKGTTTATTLRSGGLLKGWSSPVYYYVTRAIVNNPSANLSAGSAGVRASTGGSGNIIVTDVTLSVLNAATVTLNQTLAIVHTAENDLIYSSVDNYQLYYRVGDAAAGNADFYLYGIILP